MSTGVTFPPELLAKFKVSDTFDQEIKGYVLNRDGSNGYYQWLALVAQHAGARLILELGNRHGASTLALYHGLQPECQLVTVDTVVDQRYVPDFIHQDPRVHFVFGDCLDLSAYERAQTAIPIDIDVFWTDTVHYYAQLADEFFVYESLLADECLVVIDDIHLNDKGRFFKEMPYEKYDLDMLCHKNGFGVFGYRRPEAERGKPKEQRLHQALLRSMETGYRRFWAEKTAHEALIEDLRQTGPVGQIRKIKHLTDILLRRR